MAFNPVDFFQGLYVAAYVKWEDGANNPFHKRA